MEIKLLEKDQYKNHSKTFPLHIMQSFEWGEVKKPQWKPFHYGVFNGETPISLITVLLRPIPVFKKYIAYIPRGILVSKQSLYQEVLSLIKIEVEKLNAICLLIDPDTPFHQGIKNTVQSTQRIRKLLVDSGFKKVDRTLQPMRTVVLDLTKTEDELLADMRSKHRQYIRKAHRNGVVIKKGSLSDFEMFYGLLQKISSQKGYEIHTKEYHRKVYEIFQKSDDVVLLLAKVKGKTVGAYMVFFYGETAYEMYGGCPRMGKDLLGNYPLKWESIKYAKAKGVKYYDQWGAEYIYPGLVQFKEGFGGHVVDYLPQFGVSLKPFGISTYRVIWKVNSILRRVLKF